MKDRFCVDISDAGIRLDRWFYRHFADVPFNLVARLIRQGHVRVDGKRTKIHYRLQHNQQIKVPSIERKQILKPASSFSTHFVHMRDAFIKSIIFEDENIIVINKPSGLCTQGGSNVRISVDSLLASCNMSYKIVHRLDKDTTGALILAKTAFVASEMGHVFVSMINENENKKEK